MRARSALSRRVLPHGVLDVLRAGRALRATYYAYRLVRGLVDDPQGAAVAFEHARDIIDIERSLGIFVEPQLQDCVGATSVVGDAAQLDLRQRADHGDARRAHLPLPVPQPQLLLRAQHVHGRDGRSRSSATSLFPTAPPRFFPEWGFTDTVADFTGVDADERDGRTRSSTRTPRCRRCTCAFALMIGCAAGEAREARAGAQVSGPLYPLLVTFVDRRDRQPLPGSTPSSAPLTAGAAPPRAAVLARARPAGLGASAPARGLTRHRADADGTRARGAATRRERRDRATA